MSVMQLTPFLRDKNPQVRQIALANLLGQTPKGSPHRDLFYAGLRGGGLQQTQENDVVRDIKILCRDQLVYILSVRLVEWLKDCYRQPPMMPSGLS